MLILKCSLANTTKCQAVTKVFPWATTMIKISIKPSVKHLLRKTLFKLEITPKEISQQFKKTWYYNSQCKGINQQKRRAQPRPICIRSDLQLEIQWPWSLWLKYPTVIQVKVKVVEVDTLTQLRMPQVRRALRRRLKASTCRARSQEEAIKQWGQQEVASIAL